MLKILAVMTGGALGPVSRYLLFPTPQRVGGTTFPVGILTARLPGSFAIGPPWSLLEGTRLNNGWRPYIFTGFLGGFTTFSTFTLETTQLFTAGKRRAPWFFLDSNTLGLLLVFSGYYLTCRYLLAA